MIPDDIDLSKFELDIDKIKKHLPKGTWTANDVMRFLFQCLGLFSDKVISISYNDDLILIRTKYLVNVEITTCNDLHS